MPQIVIVGDLPGHSEITGSKPNDGNGTNQSQRQHYIHKGVGDVNAAESAMERMGEDNYKIGLVQNAKSPVLSLTASKKACFSRLHDTRNPNEPTYRKTEIP
jgi:hypothetical protein